MKWNQFLIITGLLARYVSLDICRLNFLNSLKEVRTLTYLIHLNAENVNLLKTFMLKRICQDLFCIAEVN